MLLASYLFDIANSRTSLIFKAYNLERRNIYIIRGITISNNNDDNDCSIRWVRSDFVPHEALRYMPKFSLNLFSPIFGDNT